MPPKSTKQPTTKSAAKPAKTTTKVAKPAKVTAPKPAKVVKDTEPKVKKPRVPVTRDTVLSSFGDLVAVLDAEIEVRSKSREHGSRFLKTVRRQLLALEKRTDSLLKRSLKKPRASHNGGFKVTYPISADLSKFLKVKADEKMNRQDVTRAICVYSKLREGESRVEMLRWAHLNPRGKRDLQNESNKKALLPDKTLSDLLNYEQYKQDVADGKVEQVVKDKEGNKTTKVVTDDALYYYVVQKLVQPHFL